MILSHARPLSSWDTNFVAYSSMTGIFYEETQLLLIPAFCVYLPVAVTHSSSLKVSGKSLNL